MSQILVHPGFKPHYYGYYLEGLFQVAKNVRLIYTAKPFPRFGRHCLAFIWQGRKIYISAGDDAEVDEAGLEWCDLFAKVNLDPAFRPCGKVMPIGPFFPIRCRSRVTALWIALRSFCPRFSWSEHLTDHMRMLSWNLPEDCFQPQPPQPDYVFFVSTLWHHSPVANQLRANFIRACHSAAGLRFEGGLTPRGTTCGFSDVLFSARVPGHEYVARVKQSLVVFNTPAVKDCLGSKLGEFLALGKAIITTPMQRELPSPLQHGVHVHYVDGSVEAITAAIALLRRDAGYRMRLERAARQYYETYLAPRQVLSRIIRQADQLPFRGSPL